ncbi:MAG: hypothetical protein OHK0015_42180 [Chloroflexi bacterium OHK40]
MTRIMHLALIALAAVGLGIAHGGQVTATGNLGGLRATIHGPAQLSIASCLHPGTERALLVAFIDNTSDTQAGPFRVTLHAADGTLLAERGYNTILPGETKFFAAPVNLLVVAEALAEAEGPICG